MYAPEDFCPTCIACPSRCCLDCCQLALENAASHEPLKLKHLPMDKCTQRVLAEMQHCEWKPKLEEPSQGSFIMELQTPASMKSKSLAALQLKRHRYPGVAKSSPSLAATHPAYFAPPALPKAQLDCKQPPIKPQTARHHRPKPAAPVVKIEERHPPLPWQVYTDPKHLLSDTPQFDVPQYRMLKMDVDPDMPRVVSPTFIIGLPLGSMIEGANRYAAGE